MKEREFKLKKSEFDALRQIVYDRTGITLKESKYEMVYSRLARRIRSLELDSFGDYLAYLKSAEGSVEMADFVNAMTTNLTRFFREGHHFQHMRQEVLLAKVEGARRNLFDRTFRVWSAGCSSGMEPYSIAMTVKASLPSKENWKTQILATDIDTNMLSTGMAGRYRKKEAESIPEGLAKKYVRYSDDQAIMADELKEMISFKKLNLMEEWPIKKPFDVIFCRNVMIYFDTPTQKKLIDKFVNLLTPNGTLYVGHAEALVASHPRLVSVGKSSFIMKDQMKVSV
ncbi:CheR family methyltransferase [Kordiimonas pumila]|uniref:Chemotaxis protein methyltransferase n=1 Tax=Kordiimonas pumila TaxID=2161677 RepID=A0ABV7D0Z2_9PROT|nr:protein-glutamate O-methyltransferase [Kordiimonas pumila]